MAIIQKMENYECWRGCGEIRALVGIRNGASAVENSLAVPQNLNKELPFDPAISLSGKYPKELN